MRKKIFIGFTVFIAVQIVLFFSNTYAQGSFRERIREKIKERLKERPQIYGPGDYDFSLQHG